MNEISLESEVFNFDLGEVTKDGKYRLGVGAVIKKNGLIFCATRLDNVGSDKEQTIQMPQGGVDEGEGIFPAVLREVFEETGIKSSNLKFIARTKEFLYYDVPRQFQGRIGGKIGQVQIWYCFDFLGKEGDINLEASHEREFVEFFFKKPEEIIEKTILFKRDLYIKIFSLFGLIK